MSDPQSYVNIRIHNKKLYAFLLKYAKKGCFKGDNLIVTSGSPSCEYPSENLSSMMCHNTNNDNYLIHIFDPFQGDIYHVPEGVYDIVPCLLIYLANMFRWDQGKHDAFVTFRDEFLTEKAAIEKHFDKVLWEVEWLDNRYSWDGIYKWTEKFYYDRFQDESEHTKTVYKLGLDLEDKEAIKKRTKYSDYDWDSLSYAGGRSLDCVISTEFDYADEDFAGDED